MSCSQLYYLRCCCIALGLFWFLVLLRCAGIIPRTNAKLKNGSYFIIIIIIIRIILALCWIPQRGPTSVYISSSECPPSVLHSLMPKKAVLHRLIKKNLLSDKSPVLFRNSIVCLRTSILPKGLSSFIFLHPALFRSRWRIDFPRWPRSIHCHLLRI